MRNFGVLSFILVLAGVSASVFSSFAGENPKTGVTVPAAKATLDQLYAVQNLLRVELIGESVCTREFSGLNAGAKAALPQLLEAEIETKLGRMRMAKTLEAYLREPKRASMCEARCRCEAYASALGKEAPVAPRPESDFLKCAKANADWICSSRVVKALVSEGRLIE
ncbi:MAG: hypothetical protein H7301_12610 [Cryobacterium sp.]|nr:hypothetical protein [Oligoflexia bacterium]